MNLFTAIALKIHYWNRYRLFKKLFQKEDPYQSEHNNFEQFKLGSILNEIKDRKYNNALEIGCGEGFLTVQLLKCCNQIIGIDISPTAIQRAQQRYKKEGIIFKCMNIINFQPNNLFDLIVAVDICYYLAQEHSWKHIQEELSKWANLLHPKGQIVLAHGFNESSHPKDWLGCNIMEGYRKILENAGLCLKKEKTIHGVKEGISHSCLISILEKP